MTFVKPLFDDPRRMVTNEERQAKPLLCCLFSSRNKSSAQSRGLPPVSGSRGKPQRSRILPSRGVIENDWQGKRERNSWRLSISRMYTTAHRPFYALAASRGSGKATSLSRAKRKEKRKREKKKKEIKAILSVGARVIRIVG
jgi:hypothetical protein